MPEGIVLVVLTVIGNILAMLLPAELMAVTDMLPEAVPQLTTIDSVFWPETKVAPAGTIQLYEVADSVAGMVYVADVLAQTVSGPDM